MKKPENAPASKPEPSPLERMTEFTRRIVAVPKSELPMKRGKPNKRK